MDDSTPRAVQHHINHARKGRQTLGILLGKGGLDPIDGGTQPELVGGRRLPSQRPAGRKQIGPNVGVVVEGERIGRHDAG